MMSDAGGEGGVLAAWGRRGVRIATLVVAVVVVTGAVRLAGLTREPLFVDEAYSARFSSGATNRILDLIAKDVHPPAYYLGLAAWQGLLGDSVWGLRAFSVVWSLLGVGALMLLARSLTRSWAAVLAVAAMIAVHPLDVAFAQTARMYSQLAALSTFAAWLLWRWMTVVADDDGVKTWFGWAAAYTATAMFLLHTHYLAVVLLIAQGMFSLGLFAFNRRWFSFGGYVICAGVTAVAFLPWIDRVLRFRDGLYSQPHLGWIPETGVGDGVRMLFRELLWGGVRLHAPWASLATVAAACIVVVATFLLVRSICRPAHGRCSEDALDNLRLGYALWLLVGPVAIAVVVGFLYHPVYYPPRFAVLVLPPFLILLGRAYDEFGPPCSRWVATAVTLALLAGSTVIQAVVVSGVRVDGFVELWQTARRPAMVVFFPRHAAKTVSYYLNERIRSATPSDVEGLVAAGGQETIWVCTVRTKRPRSSVDREFRRWLLALGPRRRLVRDDDLEVVRVRVGPTGRSSHHSTTDVNRGDSPTEAVRR